MQGDGQDYNMVKVNTRVKMNTRVKIRLSSLFMITMIVDG